MESATVTRVPDADDDLLEIRFGPRDPAIKKLTFFEVRRSVDISLA
jgi:hypothetical protein